MKASLLDRRGLTTGFTLLELLVVMLVLSLLATGYYGPQLLAETRRIKRTQADVVAQEISLLGAAAQAYTLAHQSGDWPRQAQDCLRAHEQLTERLPSEAFSRDTAFYRGPAAGFAAPFMITDGQLHLGRYYFDCSENPDGERPLFRVRLALGEDTAVWAEYIANQLPNPEIVVNSDVRSLEVGWPLPSALPALDALVAKNDPVFEADLDVNGHAIFAAEEVILEGGQTLASSLQYAGIAAPGNLVDKPRCPPGLVPQVVTVPIELSHEVPQPITYFRAYATDIGNAWRISSTVHGTDSQSTGARMRMSVFTLCS